MKTVSLCMIVKDEEDVIARCLSSAQKIADEIVIVDTGSTDRTREICRAFTQKIYDFPWTDDFSAARNESYSHASMDYVMWLDADDFITEEDARKFLALKELLHDEDVVMCRYHTSFDADGRPVFSYYRERLTKRSAKFVWEGMVHECIVPRGNILYSDAAVAHRKERPAAPSRNLGIYRKMRERGLAFSPRHKFYFARELYYNELYGEARAAFEDFLSTPDSWYVNCIEACSMLAECCRKLGERGAVLPILFQSFLYDRPRAEILCEIGSEFMEQKRWDTACYWYEAALACRPDPTDGSFIRPDCYDFIPLLQLCVCRDKMGQTKLAEEYNLRAAALKPNHPSVLANLAYFATKH